MTAGDNALEGLFRIVFADASENERIEVFRTRSELLDLNTDLRQQLIIPKSTDIVSEDDKIILEYYADTATNVQMNANTIIRIPITIRNIKTGNTFQSMLAAATFGTTNSGTLTASTWTKITSYTVTAQEQIKLGVVPPENSRIYVTLKTTG